MHGSYELQIYQLEIWKKAINCESSFVRTLGDPFLDSSLLNNFLVRMQLRGGIADVAFSSNGWLVSR